jgi:MFS family permease
VSVLTWTAYVLMACEGYLIYAVGFITPYLQQELGVRPWVAALPNSVMAVGLLASGVVARAVNDRIGPRYAVRTWAGGMSVSGVLMAIPASIVPILVGAFVFGLSLGGVLIHVNGALGVGPRGGTMLMRANVWSMIGGLAGPLVLAAAAAGAGWWFGMLVPVPLLVALVLLLPASPARDRPVAGSEAGGSLPRLYWMTWLFLVLSIGAEFSFVVWGPQVVTARSGIPAMEATRLASLYVLGMMVGRLALSAGLGHGSRSILVLRGGAALAVAGALVTWLATQPAVAGLGLLLAGLGMSALYPLGASLALAHAPGLPVRASARLTAASGLAILSAPLALGVVAGGIGVFGAWLIVLGLLGTGLLVVLRIPPPPRRRARRRPRRRNSGAATPAPQLRRRNSAAPSGPGGRAGHPAGAAVERRTTSSNGRPRSSSAPGVPPCVSSVSGALAGASRRRRAAA